MIASAIENPACEGCGGAFFLKGTESTGPLTVVVAPLPIRTRREDSLGAMVLVTAARCHVPDATRDMLRSVFGLTPAEARLAVGLANGQTLHGYADAANVSVETARCLLKRSMKKTGVHRQSEFVRLITLDFGFIRDVRQPGEAS